MITTEEHVIVAKKLVTLMEELQAETENYEEVALNLAVTLVNTVKKVRPDLFE